MARNAGRARARKGEAQELLNGNNLKGIKNNPHRGRYLAPPSGTPRVQFELPSLRDLWREFTHTAFGIAAWMGFHLPVLLCGLQDHFILPGLSMALGID